MPKNIHHLTIGSEKNETSQDGSAAANAPVQIPGTFGNQTAINLPKNNSPTGTNNQTPNTNSSDVVPKKTGIYIMLLN
jgi:hypothetical protein